jgi:ketosteroid isomerase-like protein
VTSDEAQRAENLATATRALAAISRMDIPAALAETHPDLAFELPFEKVVPTLDRAGFDELLTGVTADFQTFAMDIVEVLPGLDPNVLVVRYDGDCLARDGSFSYRNNYLGVLNFTDGLISRWREYENPMLSKRMNDRLAALGAPS